MLNFIVLYMNGKKKTFPDYCFIGKTNIYTASEVKIAQ